MLPAGIICLTAGFWQSASPYEIWRDQLCSFVGRYSSSFSFLGGGVLACRGDRIPTTLQITAFVENPVRAAEAFRAAPFNHMLIQGDRIYFPHLGSLITLEHRSNDSWAPDFQHQLLRLDPVTGVFSDPYGIASQRFPALCLACSPSELGIGLQICFSGLLESVLHGLILSDSFLKLEGHVLQSKVRTDVETLNVYSALVMGLASLIEHIGNEKVTRLIRSSLVDSTLKQLGGSSEMILARERLLSIQLPYKSRAMGCLATLLATFPQTTTAALQTSRRFPVGPALRAIGQAANIARLSL